jgi:DNA-binding IclR family transcriptional regulator
VPNGPERVSDVLDLLAQAPAGLSAQEVADSLNLSRAAGYRLVNLMVDSSLLERVGNGENFAVAPQLWATASTALRHIPLLEASLLPMADGVRSSGHSVILGINRDAETIFLRRVERMLDYVLVQPTGSRAPIHLTATGRAILAHEPEEVREKIISLHLERRSEATLVGKALAKELYATRSRGYALNYGVHQADARGIAVAIFDSRRRPVAALGTSVPERGTEEDVLPILREVAGAISRTLGFIREEALILP